MLVKISVDGIIKYFYYFYHNIILDISCKLSPGETIYTKYQNLFSGERKKDVIKLSSAEFAQSVKKVKYHGLCTQSITISKPYQGKIYILGHIHTAHT